MNVSHFIQNQTNTQKLFKKEREPQIEEWRGKKWREIKQYINSFIQEDDINGKINFIFQWVSEWRTNKLIAKPCFEKLLSKQQCLLKRIKLIVLQFSEKQNMAKCQMRVMGWTFRAASLRYNEPWFVHNFLS